MEKHYFYQDIKCTIWQRQYFIIEAESEEEANEIAKRYGNIDVSREEPIYNSENLYETMEYIEPEENNDCATINVYNKRTNELIAENGK